VENKPRIERQSGGWAKHGARDNAGKNKPGNYPELGTPGKHRTGSGGRGTGGRAATVMFHPSCACSTFLERCCFRKNF